ncbi:hypothetical protein [Croceicoccus gelatinilyticus]|uniref:hypothetical protein n=1 Tax=Croceicoccus gelatinilyticus TaxID=2835536 RepID=UPI001BCD39B2|nr:hypothetical protein [Croceicoccus gelatinilyticus]MBS7671551.1 hypothetical protein [Croceicoccus gelatinilyticus]
MTYDDFHYIEVPDAGYITCSCQGVDWCSHIEATLVFGERAMVPEEDHPIANRAMVKAKGRLERPKHWKADWLSKRRWRGLPVKEPKAIAMLKSGVPVVSFEGRGRKRQEAKDLATEHGWRDVSIPTRGVLVHVSDAMHGDPRLEKAKELGIMTVTYAQWPMIASIGDKLRQRARRFVA